METRNPRKAPATGAGKLVWSFLNEGAWKTSIYEGNIRDGRLQGRGVYKWSDGDRYEGDVRDEKLHGRGIYVWANGNRYDGDYRDGKRTGRGVYMWANGSRYEGNYRDNLPHGFGDYLAVDGQIYVGAWTNGCYSQENRRAAVGVPFSQCGF
jgi:hypothetical protein